MNQSGLHSLKLFLHFQIHDMRYHCAQNRCIQRVFVNIVFLAAQILYKIKPLIQMSVIPDDVGGNHLHPGNALCLQNLIEFFPDGEHAHCLKTLKINICLCHGRNGFSRLQNKYADQSKIADTHDTLSCQLRVSLIQQNAIFIVNGACQPHSRLQIIAFYKTHTPVSPCLSYVVPSASYPSFNFSRAFFSILDT